MKIQFCHVRRYENDNSCECCGYRGESQLLATGGKTIAIEELSKWFLLSLQEGDFFEKKVGKAICSNEDNYNKKIGAELSSKRMKLTKLQVSKIIKVNNAIVHLSDTEGNIYTFVTVGGSERARFINYKGV